jgi:hypothetical protein
MPNRDDILWFKQQFQARITPALAGTPLTVDFLAAIACQETGHIWSILRRKGLSTDRVLALCVGDTLDFDRGRKAFPQTRDDLVAAPRGPEMFALARQALVDMAQHVPGFNGAVSRPHKFCHAFGIFQLDLQFFKVDPDYFLSRAWERFEPALDKCLGELKRGLRKLAFEGRDSLTDLELAAVGITYNTGRFVPSKGLKQGHFNGTQFYGEALMDFLRLAHTVSVPGEDPAIAPLQPGVAIVAPPPPATAQGPRLRVRTQTTSLRLRSEPRVSSPPQANVVANLPDGQPVRAFTGTVVNGFIEVEAQMQGALMRGFAGKDFLVPEPERAAAAPMRGMARGPSPSRGPLEVAQAQPMPPPPTAPIPPVALPRPEGLVTRRKDAAGNHSLNEPGQPQRKGTEPAELRAEMDAIIDWLAVDKATHKRWRAAQGRVFANVYAHDVCHLAGVYLPLVWWTPGALLRLAGGSLVAPLIGDTVQEMTSNDLFRWLRDHGQAFGWRQAGSLTELQTEVNLGAVGLVMARRKEEGRSGHVAVVVPETGAHSARRASTGAVLAPLQSQASTRNVRRARGRAGWWNEAGFADAAFWLHG